jgi:hypothetical protein
MFPVSLTIKGDNFSEEYQPAGICNGAVVQFLPCKNWIFTYDLDECDAF